MQYNFLVVVLPHAGMFNIDLPIQIKLSNIAISISCGLSSSQNVNKVDVQLYDLSLARDIPVVDFKHGIQ